MNPSPDRANIEPDLAEPGPGDPRAIAAEQFAHGLLQTLHLDTTKRREHRIAATLDRLSAPPIRIRRVFPWQVASGLAAAAITIVALVLLALPTQSSAVALVQQSVAAVKSAGQRRYEVRIMLPRDTQLQRTPLGTLDIGDEDHVLIQARTPFGDQIVVGRDTQGAWAIRPDGSVDRYPPRHAWPKWVNDGQNTLMLASVDELLGSLEESYQLERAAGAQLPSGEGPAMGRVTATRKAGAEASPGPRRIELWIDPATHVVTRMELHWDVSATGPSPSDPPRRGDGRKPPRRPDGPPPGPRPGGRPPDGPPRDGPPPDHRRPPPEFLGGPPDFKAGHHPPPPRMLVFELVQSAAFADSWFSPESHAAEIK